jgi:ABC-type antimicrobial peptide transport system permease subunit
MLMVALGVFNTILMSMMERKREFGVLKAIGTKPTFLGQMIVLETLIMNSLSIVIGFVIAFGLNYYFSIHGIEFKEPFEYGGFIFKEMNSIVNLNSFCLPAIVVSVTSFVVSLFPAIKAARITPIEALRD